MLTGEDVGIERITLPLSTSEGERKVFDRLARADRIKRQRKYETNQKHSDASTMESRLFRSIANDIYPVPDCENPDRRASTEKNLQLFLTTYFPMKFRLRWSRDHIELIKTCEESVLHGGGLFANALPRGQGKALAIDTPIPTLNGWVNMGDIKPGDHVYGEDGKLTKVLWCSDVMYDRKCYTVTFSDGHSIVCDAEHLWTVKPKDRCKTTLRTWQLSQDLEYSVKRGWTEWRYKIPLTQPIHGEDAEYLIHPYVLGLWLGDGTSASPSITSHDMDVQEYVSSITECKEPYVKVRKYRPNVSIISLSPGRGRADSRTKRAFGYRLDFYGLIESKHIPPEYLRGTVSTRRALLQGLMDTDGTIMKDGSGQCEYVTKLVSLRDGMTELLTSLGIKYYVTERFVTLNGKQCGPYYRIRFTAYTQDQVFRLKRKAGYLRVGQRTLSANRQIVSVEPCASVPVKCIAVDNKSHLYLCGRGMIPTHNSTIAEGAGLWALSHAHKRFLMLVAATAKHGREMFVSIMTEIETNDTFAADFPEICYPIRVLRGNYIRAKFQHCQGEAVRMSISNDKFVFPTLTQSKVSGSVIHSASITGRLRGIKHSTSNGETIRPDIALVDDPQTDRSAKSAGMTASREKIIQGTIRGLAGPDSRLTIVMPCTVIHKDDLAERFLDRAKRPEWQGQRNKLLISFPTNLDIWNTYNDIRGKSFNAGNYGREATEFYVANRAEMDKGAEVSWEERYDRETQVSAIQAAMDLYFSDPVAFASEYQNEPLAETNSNGSPRISLNSSDILQRYSGLALGTVPRSTQFITGGIDIQGKILYYLFTAWTEDFGGVIVKWGSYPRQPLDYFIASDPPVTYSTIDPTLTLSPQVFKGLDWVHKEIVTKGSFVRDETKSLVPVDKIFIDANWNTSADAVYGFCKQYEASSNNLYSPVHGKGIGASMLPMDQYQITDGVRKGLNWMQRFATQRNNRGRHVTYDTNFWKSLVAERLINPKASEKGALLLSGEYSTRNQLIADHLSSEDPITTMGRGRYVDEWKLRAGQENHWWDCLVMSAVAANFAGLVPHTITQHTPDGRIETKAAETAKRRVYGSRK